MWTNELHALICFICFYFVMSILMLNLPIDATLIGSAVQADTIANILAIV